MKKNHGFTLVELLATVSIMAILLMIAIPSVLTIIEKNKNTTYINDAKKLVAMAKYKMKSDPSVINPSYADYYTYGPVNRCVAFRFSTLIKENEINEGPEGGNYNLDDSASFNQGSFVIVKYDNTNKQNIYAVQLIEKYKINDVDGYKGIPFIENVDNLAKKNASNKYISSKKESFVEPTDNNLQEKFNCNSITWY
ncbi:MAG: prepilin-type N-terminal cleavage/methylation domain-containing protein [Bacilli bacterium]|nr:prepilin-type N-terminal cleavage/methylation domain-containing protein [Bacilli bacterium]